jgi:hypothetical protein
MIGSKVTKGVYAAPAGRLLLSVAVIVMFAFPLGAQHAGVTSTLHNLSVSGPGEIKSQTETEVCKFCHIPHSAVVPQPLWGHTLSRVEQYQVPQIRRGRDTLEPAPQPDGTSRLCLSCHDGTIALGKIAGERKTVPMIGNKRLAPGRNGFIGTDLSGSHPISFEVPDGDPKRADTGNDMGLKPRSAIESVSEVRLDQDGKMQCTTCHDAHADKYYKPGKVPHFWVKPTVAEVCLTCHELR